MEQAKPELIKAAQDVISAFLESGSGSDYQRAVDELFAVMREHGGRDALTEAVLAFKRDHLTWMVNGSAVSLNALNAAATKAAVELAAGIEEEMPLAAGDEPVVDTTPYLYILMRTDLASMNAGKAVAQGSHAANQMIFEAMIATDPLSRVLDGNRAVELSKAIREWSSAARGFGTCIVLGVNEAEMRATVEAAATAGLHAGITHDPSYPVRDGSSFYTLPLDTCAYVFARKCDAAPFVKNFRLMP